MKLISDNLGYNLILRYVIWLVHREIGMVWIISSHFKLFKGRIADVFQFIKWLHFLEIDYLFWLFHSLKNMEVIIVYCRHIEKNMFCWFNWDVFFKGNLTKCCCKGFNENGKQGWRIGYPCLVPLCKMKFFEILLVLTVTLGDVWSNLIQIIIEPPNINFFNIENKKDQFHFIKCFLTCSDNGLILFMY